MTIWCIVAVLVWNQLFPKWVYSDERERLPRNLYQYGGNLLKVCKEQGTIGGGGENINPHATVSQSACSTFFCFWTDVVGQDKSSPALFEPHNVVGC